MNDAQIKHMVDRFLGWRLPEDFSPDGGISFKKTFNEHTAHPMKHEPTGTNLFDATQAKAMVRYMIEGLPGEEQESVKTSVYESAVEGRRTFRAMYREERDKAIQLQADLDAAREQSMHQLITIQQLTQMAHNENTKCTKLSDAVGVFLKDRMAAFPDSRCVDDDLVVLATVLNTTTTTPTPTIQLPTITPDQAEYLENIRRNSVPDMEVTIGGPGPLDK